MLQQPLGEDDIEAPRSQGQRQRITADQADRLPMPLARVSRQVQGFLREVERVGFGAQLGQFDAVKSCPSPDLDHAPPPDVQAGDDALDQPVVVLAL